jgi:hypothetical protein
MAAIDQLDRLRKAVERGQRPDEAKDLRDIEKRIKTLDDYDSLAKRPAIAELLQWMKDEISGINERLSTDRKVDQQAVTERLAIMEKRDVLLYFVGLFDPSAELASIEKMLLAKVEEYEEYNGIG